MNSTFDPTTVAFSGEHLLKTGVNEEIFEMFERYLRSQSL